MGSKKEAKYLAYFVTKSYGFVKGTQVFGLLCQRVMGSKREAKYLAYFFTKSNGFKKGGYGIGFAVYHLP